MPPTAPSPGALAQGWLEFYDVPEQTGQLYIAGRMYPTWVPDQIRGHLDWVSALISVQLSWIGLPLTYQLVVGSTGVLNRITMTATGPGAAFNYTLGDNGLANVLYSGPTLTGGQDATPGSPGVRGTPAISGIPGKPEQNGGSWFANGQVIFRSGLLLNESYEIQSNDGPYLSLFTPLEFPPEVGDVVDVICGCDHSPFVMGCGRYKNILNYRGEPWCPGGVSASTLATQAPGSNGAWAPWITVS